LRQVCALLGPIDFVGWAVLVSSAEASYLGSAARTASGAIVLGSKTYMTPDGEGWGTLKPTIIFNGSDPSGYMSGIQWQQWGQKSAIGWGFTWIFKPTGGYYHIHVRAELRATDIGRCTAQGPLAYRCHYARVPSRSGGPLGPWSP
jgi:hypothetical protein